MMLLKGLGCQASKFVNRGACPRPTPRLLRQFRAGFTLYMVTIIEIYSVKPPSRAPSRLGPSGRRQYSTVRVDPYSAASTLGLRPNVLAAYGSIFMATQWPFLEDGGAGVVHPGRFGRDSRTTVPECAQRNVVSGLFFHHCPAERPHLRPALRYMW
jgi:hypothetical protein